MSALTLARRYRPGAVPFPFGKTCAPAGTLACRGMRSVDLIPRLANRFVIVARTRSSWRNSSPRSSAVSSRVISSLVGPSPPVTNNMSARGNICASACEMASPSGTVRCSSTRKPSGRISRAMKARWASCTSPSNSSVPVLMRRTRIQERTFNTQCSTSTFRNLTSNVGR
jgi:hypothetical protein